MNGFTESNPIDEEVKKLADQDMRDAGLLPNIRDVTTLIAENPTLKTPVIFGLLREGEICNVIAPPKTGKSWLTLDLAVSVALGRQFLGTFDTKQGKVLILDNELHPETFATRVPMVCQAMEIEPHTLAGRLSVDCLRGRLVDLVKMDAFFHAIPPGEYKMIVLDAFYRFVPSGWSENDNGAMAQLYNLLDCHAKRLGGCFVLIHHSSKGNQSAKSVTDIGAGAGSMSRAADCHLTIRKHADEGLHVLDAAVRSWASLEPVSVRFDFPLWFADGTEPKLAVPQSRHTANKDQDNKTDIELILKEYSNGERFNWCDVKKTLGCGETRADRIIRIGLENKDWSKAGKFKKKHARKETMMYQVTTETDN